MPYFWTDQFDAHIHVPGAPSADAEATVIAGDPDAGRFLALYREDGRITGILGWHMPEHPRLRRHRFLEHPVRGDEPPSQPDGTPVLLGGSP